MKRFVLCIIAILFVLCDIANAGVLITNPKFQAFDSNGYPLASGKLYTYLPGTSTNKATYTTRTLASANANPVILDSRGEASIFGHGLYKLVLKDSADTTIWTMDNVEFVGAGGAYILYPDPSETDQGAAGNGTSLYDYLTTLGTSKKATVRFTHNGSSDTTSYIVSTTFNASTYTNINFEFENGSILSVDTGITATLPSPSNIIASPNQQIFSGAGTVAFNLPGIIHPAWYGTPKNGTDNSATYWTAINTSMAADSTIELEPDANYYLNTASGVTFSKKVHIKGFGAKFTIGTTTGNAPGITVSAAESILENFEVVGDLHNAAGGAFDGSEDFTTNLKRSVKITGNHITCRKLDISNSVYGISYESVTGGEIADCQVANTTVGAGDGNGTYCAGININDSSYVKAHGNYITGHSQGILLGTSYDCIISANHVSDCDDNAIYVSSESQNSVVNNDVWDFDGSGVKIRGSYNIVSNNRIRSLAGGSSTGITITGNGTPTGDYNGYGVQVLGNNIYGHLTYAISSGVQDAGYLKDAMVVDNVIELSGGTAYAISQTGPGDGWLMRGNKSSGHTYGIILQPGTGKYFDNAIIANNLMPAGTEHGLYCTRIRYSNITGNTFSNYNRAAGAEAGIYLVSCTYNNIRNNFVGDTQAVATQDWGVYEYDTDCGSNIIENNYTLGTVSAGVIFYPESGTITLSNEGVSRLDASGGNVAATLGDGDYIGQRKMINAYNVDNTITLTVTHHETSDPEIFTFDTVGDYLILEWGGSDWVTVKNFGVTV